MVDGIFPRKTAIGRSGIICLLTSGDEIARLSCHNGFLPDHVNAVYAKDP